VDVRERIEPGAGHRCPYCHDLLEGARPDDDLVVCGGCGTRHHGACLDELGRCTVLGCGWISPTALELPHIEDARTVEDLRHVIRLRVARYLEGRARRPPTAAAVERRSLFTPALVISLAIGGVYLLMVVLTRAGR
jgi:hypothetical protein